MWYWSLILAVLASTVSCRIEEGTSDVKFMLGSQLPSSQEKKLHEMYERDKRYIIDDILTPDLKIGYYLHPDCNFNDEQSEEIRQAIEDALWTWVIGDPKNPLARVEERVTKAKTTKHLVATELSGSLAAGKEIFKGLDIEKVNANDYEIKMARSDDNLNLGKRAYKRKGAKEDDYLFTVHFYCGLFNPGSNELGIGGGRTNFPVDKNEKIHVGIYLPSRRTPLPEGMMSDQQKELYKKLPKKYEIESTRVNNLEGTGVNKYTLLHELGHPFGLMDTYLLKEGDDKVRRYLELFAEKEVVDNLPPRGDRIVDINNPSQLQPESVMGLNVRGGGYNGSPGIYPDDAKGFRAMFEKYFGNSKKP